MTPTDHILIGVSGGPDSVCLLHVLHTLAPSLGLKLTVAHLDHQLRGAAGRADAQFVSQLAKRWQVPVVVATEDVPAFAAKHKLSLEEAARQVRYAFLWRVASEMSANKVAVGHNADDQAETVLMHFLRGSGLAGLRGMRPLVSLDRLLLEPVDCGVQSPSLIRPLLETPRADIEAYCRANALPTRQDASNQEPKFFRNRLRHELLPYLETYNPNIRQVLQRTAKVVAADLDLLTEQEEQAWPQVLRHASPQRLEFDLAAWRALPLALKRALLRRAGQTLGRQQSDLSFEHIESALELLERGGAGRQATLPHDLVLTVGYETLTIAQRTAPAAPPDEPFLRSQQPVPVTVPGSTALPQTAWRLHAKIIARREITEAQLTQARRWEVYLDADLAGPELVLRPRQSGDIFAPIGLQGHHKKLKTFMVDEKIPADRRGSLPLLVAPSQMIVWVCGYRPDERVRVTPDTKRVLHLWFERAEQPHLAVASKRTPK